MRIFLLERRGQAFVLMTLIAVLAASLIDFGCTQQEQDPAKRVLAKSVKALGGIGKTRSWTTRIERGTLTQNRPGWGTLQAECAFYVKKPDKLKMDQDFSAYDNPFYFEYYYNGGDAWAVVNANTHQNPRITQSLEEFMADVDGLPFYYEECDTFFLPGEVPDDSLFAGDEITRVGCVQGGDTVLIDVCRDSFLPLRMIKEGGSTHIIYEDYRPAGKIKTAFHRMMYENGAMTADYVWEEVVFDEEIDDSFFESNRPPADEGSG